MTVGIYDSSRPRDKSVDMDKTVYKEILEYDKIKTSEKIADCRLAFKKNKKKQKKRFNKRKKRKRKKKKTFHKMSFDKDKANMKRNMLKMLTYLH